MPVGMPFRYARGYASAEVCPQKVVIHAQGMITKGGCTDSPGYNSLVSGRAADLHGTELYLPANVVGFGSRFEHRSSGIAPKVKSEKVPASARVAAMVVGSLCMGYSNCHGNCQHGYNGLGIYGSCMVAELGHRDGPSMGIPGSSVRPRMRGNSGGNPRASSEGRKSGWTMSARGKWERGNSDGEEVEAEQASTDVEPEDAQQSNGVQGKPEEWEVRLGVIHAHHTVVEDQLRGKIDQLERRLNEGKIQGGVLEVPPGLEGVPPTQKDKSEEGVTEKVIVIPRSCAPQVLGTKGVNIKEVKNRSGVRRLALEDEGDKTLVRVMGNAAAVDEAVRMVQALAGGDYGVIGGIEEKVNLLEAKIAGLIGPRGACIKALQKQAGVYMEVKNCLLYTSDAADE